jgi:hypothetical protein
MLCQPADGRCLILEPRKRLSRYRDRPMRKNTLGQLRQGPGMISLVKSRFRNLGPPREAVACKFSGNAVSEAHLPVKPTIWTEWTSDRIST